MRNWGAAMLVLAGLGFATAPIGAAFAATPSGHHAAATEGTSTGQLHQFKTEAEAKSQCPGGQVAWANTRTHVLHEPGTQYFGKTKHGAYVCKNVALKSGYHEPGKKG